MTGTAIGIMVGFLICIIVFKFFNKDGKAGTKYDEMQERTRGKAYKYAFWCMTACEVVLCVLSSGNMQLPLDGISLHFSTILVGVLVQVSYCIWKDAYIGLNTNTKRFVIVSIVIGLCNFVGAYGAIRSGSMIIDGKLQSPFVNLLCGILFVIVGAEIFIKYMVDQRETRED